MEQQQCPICMLYLLPGMNLSDHLDTHPKDMIIKALLSSKPAAENAKPVETTTNSATVFLAPQQFGHTTQAQIYQDQQQSNFSLAKRPQSHNSALLLNNRPYRLTIDATSNIVSTPTTTFLNTNSAGLSCSRSGPLVAATSTSSNSSDNGEIYEVTPAVGSSSGAGYQQKNIMIVNTSSTQFIQQTLPVKKQATTAAIELHPVFIDNSKMSSQNPISIIPRYTNEKYSGPPPSYSTAISSVTNTINDKQPRVIDLTQTPAKMSMKNFNNIASTSTLSSGSDDNCHFMIASSAPQQKILEYSRAENGDLMITEKLLPSSSSQSMTIEHEEVVEEVHVRGGNSAESYTIKYVDFDSDMGIDVTENQFAELEKATTVEAIEHEKDSTPFRASGSSKSSTSGLKVLSDVKLTSSTIRQGMFSPTIKDIIQHYNEQQQTENDDDREVDKESDGDEIMKEVDNVNTVEMSEEVIPKIDIVHEVIEPSIEIVECIESLDISKEEEEVQREEEQPSTSTGIRHSIDTFEDVQKPSTSSGASSSVARNNVFNPTPINRLKPSKQPKKLVVKLKKPIIETGECSSSSKGTTKPEKAETERVVVKSEVEISKSPVKVESLHEKSFDTSFLDHHNYDQVNRMKIPPEIDDCETNQSLLSMDLEPETSLKKEKVNFNIVIKSEQHASSSAASNSQSSSSSSSEAGPSRLSNENSADNRNSPLNFLFQNDRVRFSPPLSPFVYLKTFSSSQSEDNCKNEGETSWNGSNSIAIQNSDHNSTSSRYTPSIEDNRSNYTDLDSGNNKTNSSEVRHRRAPSADSLNIRTDEKMPARGEISEQESNGEIEQPWHPVSLKHQFIIIPDKILKLFVSTVLPITSISKFL